MASSSTSEITSKVYQNEAAAEQLIATNAIPGEASNSPIKKIH